MSGHIFDMVNRIAQNKVRKRKKFKGDNRETIFSEKIDTTIEYDFPTVSESEMEHIKLHIQRQARADHRKSLYLLLFVLLLATAVVWAFVTFYDPGKYPLY